MALISVAIFVVATRGGKFAVSSEGGHMKIMKGEEYEVVLVFQSRGSEWIASTPTSFGVQTGQLAKVEPLSEGSRIRLRFLGTYAGRSEGISVGVSLTDPLRLFNRLDRVVSTALVLDTMPLSLLAPEIERKMKVIGYGERSTGYAGQGQELYKLDEYNPGYTRDIVWRRVASSTEETIVARVREANVTNVVRVGVVRFAKREGDELAEWTDKLCEALGEVGREALEAGASVVLLYRQGRGSESLTDEERSRGVSRVPASDVDELADAVMACSTMNGSKDVESVVGDADLVVTGLRELEDESMALVVAQRPLLLVYEKANPLPGVVQRSVVWTGGEDLTPLMRRTLER